MNEMIRRHSIFRLTPETLALLLDLLSTNGYGTTVRRTAREDEKSYNLYVFSPKDGSKPLPWGLDMAAIGTTIKEILDASKLEPVENTNVS